MPVRHELPEAGHFGFVVIVKDSENGNDVIKWFKAGIIEFIGVDLDILSLENPALRIVFTLIFLSAGYTTEWPVAF